MSWTEDLLEKLTHRGELAGLLDSLHTRLADLEEKRHEYALRCEAAEKALQDLSGRMDKMEAVLNERIGVLETDRTELFARLDESWKQLEELRERLAETESRQEDDSRMSTLEADRTELFARIDELKKEMQECSLLSIVNVAGDEEFDHRFIPLNQYFKGHGMALSMHLTSVDERLDDSVYQTADVTRTSAFALIAEEIRERKLEGSVAELGVAQGAFAEVINAHFPEKKLYLFDTFEGFPQEDADFERMYDYSDPQKHWYADINVDQVLKRMRYPQNCIVRKGYFPDTAEGLEEVFCFVSIDCDLYKPIYSGLRYFYPRLVEGGCIFVHDYRSKFFRGVKLALRRFADEQGFFYSVLPDNTGTAVIIKNKQERENGHCA